GCDLSSATCRLVAIAEGTHPFPFRTRKLSPPAPMVLGAGAPGRVGRCQAAKKDPVLVTGSLFFSHITKPFGMVRKVLVVANILFCFSFPLRIRIGFSLSKVQRKTAEPKSETSG